MLNDIHASLQIFAKLLIASFEKKPFDSYIHVSSAKSFNVSLSVTSDRNFASEWILLSLNLSLLSLCLWVFEVLLFFIKRNVRWELYKKVLKKTTL